MLSYSPLLFAFSNIRVFYYYVASERRDERTSDECSGRIASDEQIERNASKGIIEY